MVQEPLLAISFSVKPYGFEDFTYPNNLMILTVACLEVLKLEQNAFNGRKWDVKDREFPNLKVLKLRKLEIPEWTLSVYWCKGVGT